MKWDKTSQLVEEFANAAHDHHRFTLSGDYDLVNVAVARILQVIRALHDSGDTTNGALSPLLRDPRPEVALMAAVYRLKHVQQPSLETLRHLSERQDLIGFGADQAIQRWNEGVWEIE